MASDRRFNRIWASALGSRCSALNTTTEATAFSWSAATEPERLIRCSRQSRPRKITSISGTACHLRVRRVDRMPTARRSTSGGRETHLETQSRASRYLRVSRMRVLHRR